MHKLAKQKNIESLDKEYSVTDCISCGICDFVCPSNISLVDAFIKSKNTIRENAIKKEKSNIAASRHEQKLYRKDEEKKQRDMKKKLAKEKKELELIEQSKIQPSKTTSENYQIVHAKNMLKKAIEQGDNELIKEIEISINELSKITK
jgi:electron transport complex protein RnfC